MAWIGPPEVSLRKREQNVQATSQRARTQGLGQVVPLHQRRSRVSRLGTTDQTPCRGRGSAVNSAVGMEAQPTTGRPGPRERRHSSRQCLHPCAEIQRQEPLQGHPISKARLAGGPQTDVPCAKLPPTVCLAPARSSHAIRTDRASG